MTPRLIIRPGALEDLEEIATWLGEKSPAASARFLENCLVDFEKLSSNPLMGRARVFRDPRAQNIRSWIVDGFSNDLIFYRPVGDRVEILRIFHGARDIEALFEGGASA